MGDTVNASMKRQKIIFHGWLIVAVGIVAYALGYGARYSFSVIFPSLVSEFEWPRDTTAGILSVHMFVYGLAAPVAGHLVDKIGPRITMVSGAVFLALGLVIAALASEPWHFYLTFGVLAGVGLCLIGSVPFTTVIKNWFRKKSGLALSILFFGVGAGFAWYPVIAILINWVSWRGTFVTEATVVAATLLPLILLIVRYHPTEMGLSPDNAPGTAVFPRSGTFDGGTSSNQEGGTVDWTLGKATRTLRFWLLCLSSFCIWGVVQTLMVAHHVAFAMDVGYSNTYASSVLSLFGLMFACGCLCGMVSDWIGREMTMTIGTVIGISGIVVLSFVKDASRPWMLYYYAMALGFGQGITVPSVAASIVDIFQGQRVGAIIGAVWFGFSIGGTIGPWLGGWIFEVNGSYLPAFILSMVLYAVGCAALWGAAPRKTRKSGG
jgi:MFS family permease